MTPIQAEDIATQALVWLCAQDELLGAFLGQSGADPDDLRAALQAGPDHGFLGSVLDFILQQDGTVLACAGALGLGNDQLGMAAALLSGRARMHWT
jgi:hypothetical protein